MWSEVKLPVRGDDVCGSVLGARGGELVLVVAQVARSGVGRKGGGQ